MVSLFATLVGFTSLERLVYIFFFINLFFLKKIHFPMTLPVVLQGIPVPTRPETNAHIRVRSVKVRIRIAAVWRSVI